MIPKTRRIPKQLFAVLGRAKNYHTTTMTLAVHPRPATLPSLFACVVSKKAAKTAVARNRVRRQVYAALTPLLEKSHAGFVCVFYIKSPALLVGRAQIQYDITTLLRTAGVVDGATQNR